MNEARHQAEAFTDYFVLQVNGVLSLLQRIGGPGLYTKLETKLNRLCDQESWSLKIDKAEAILSSDVLSDETCRSVLGVAENYTTEVVGRKMVQGQFAKVAKAVTNMTKSAHYEYALRLDITQHIDV